MASAMAGAGQYNLKIPRISVIDALAASLRERVLSGDLLPGRPLPEAELAAQYGVARPTIRAAIQQLTLTGLLVREANRSAYVPSLTPDQVRDLFAVRTLIEIEAIRTVANNRLPIHDAEQAVARLGMFPPDAKWSDAVASDLEFHRAIVTATGSSRLLRLFSLLEDEIRLSIAQLRPAYESHKSLYEEHRELLAVIQSGDGDKAAHLLRQHLQQAINDLSKK
ncbi:MAG: GntR family transcriptional regulator [Rhodospirillaceae bacterium]